MLTTDVENPAIQDLMADGATDRANGLLPQSQCPAYLAGYNAPVIYLAPAPATAYEDDF